MIVIPRLVIWQIVRTQINLSRCIMSIPRYVMWQMEKTQIKPLYDVNSKICNLEIGRTPFMMSTQRYVILANGKDSS